MMSKLNTIIGLGVLAAAGVGIYFLFGARSAAKQEQKDAEEVQTEVPVEVSEIRRMTLHDYVVAYGSVVPSPGMSDEAPASVRIDSPQSGIITQTYCVAGQQVKKGEVLFTIYDQPAKLAVKQTEMAVSFAEQNLKRQEKLEQVNGTSTRLVEEAKLKLDSARNELSRAKVDLTLLKIKAPLDGTMTEVRARAGEAVAQGDMLAELVNLKRLMIKADVPSAEVGRLAVGQRVISISERRRRRAFRACGQAGSTTSISKSSRAPILCLCSPNCRPTLSCGRASSCESA